GQHAKLHSFPTRRSSDLAFRDGGAAEAEPAGRGRGCTMPSGSRTRPTEPSSRPPWLPPVVSGRPEATSAAAGRAVCEGNMGDLPDRKSTRLNSSHVKISYAVFC